MEKILVIDDEIELAKAVEVRLKTSGYKVEVVHDGQAGIDKAKEFKPDVILLDIVMSRMDGYGVAKKLMADSETKGIPIIIFTASQQKDLEAKWIELGVTDFITKPFEAKNLLNILDGILEHE